MVHKLLVTNGCWCCGSAISRYEEREELMLSRDIRKFCPDCYAAIITSTCPSAPTSPKLAKECASRASMMTRKESL